MDRAKMDLIMKQLQAPFPADQIEWRVQSCGISNNKPWAKVLAYVEARAIQNRLDDIFGVFGWADEYRYSNSDVICRLGVKTDEGWIYKENGASNTNIEAFKGGISGAFKRVAASGYGIGRYLYKLEEAFAECSLEKKQGWETASTKDKKTIYWKAPTLPAWALPQQTKAPSTPKVTEDQRKELFAAANKNESLLKEVIQQYGYSKTSDINECDFKDILTAITVKLAS